MGNFKVIIVGGGLSGSLLANGLLANGVCFTLYERDSEGTHREGYQIRLGDGALTGFAGCLPPERSEKIMQKLGKSFGVSQSAPSLYNSRFEQILDLTQLPSYSKTAAINRVVLRNMLLEPIREKKRIQFDKSFEGYEIVTEEGSEKVKVHFKDGSSDSCDILVAADGSRSKINIQVGLNNLIQLDRKWTFMCKGPVPHDRLMRLPAQLRRGPIGTFTSKTNMFFALYLPPQRSENEIAADENVISYDEEEASFFWGLSIPVAEISEKEIKKAQDRRALCLDRVKDWAPEFHQLISVGSQDEEVSEVYVSKLRASERPPKDWREKCQKSGDLKKGHPRIWMLGDAMHAMQPNRGQGGNQAMADCAEMLPQLLKLNSIAATGGATSTSEIAAACKAYEDVMIPRAFGWVAKSGGTKELDIDLDGWLGVLVKWIGYIAVPIGQFYHRVFGDKAK